MRVEHIALAFLVAASIASADGNAAPQTDRQIDDLSGPVKSLRFETLVFDTYTGKMDTERMPQAEEWYDENGDLIEEKSYTSDFIDDRRPQRIDAQTRLLKSNMGDQRQHRVFDSSGRLIEEKDTAATTGTQIVSWTRFKYDGHGRSIEDDNITDGKVDGFTLIKRDSRGNIVQMEFHLIGRHPPFPCDWYEDYKFDRHGNWIERRVYEFDPEAGKPRRTFAEIDYRMIEYYDNKAEQKR